MYKFDILLKIRLQLLDENLTVFDNDYVAKGDIRLKIRDILGAWRLEV